MKTISFLFLFLTSVLLGAQDTLVFDTFDYRRADSIALHFPKGKYASVTQLAGPLTSELGTEHEKFRALFRWVTDNISYSYGNRTTDVNLVLKKKKAVCAGYSELLRQMCESVGIECVVVTGWARTMASDIDRRLEATDHAWNAVKLYGRWYLVDVTWAAGAMG